MVHDQECKFDPKYCRDCKLQAEARADERYKATMRVLDAYKKNKPRQWFSLNLGHLQTLMYVYDAIEAIGARHDFKDES